MKRALPILIPLLAIVAIVLSWHFLSSPETTAWERCELYGDCSGGRP